MPSLGLPTVCVVLCVWCVCVCVRARLDGWSSKSVHACICVRVRLHFCFMFSFACGWCMLARLCARICGVNTLSARFLVCESCTRSDMCGRALSCVYGWCEYTQCVRDCVCSAVSLGGVRPCSRPLLPPCMQLEALPRNTSYFITPTVV